MNDYDIIITLGTQGQNEDEAMDSVGHILAYITENLPMDNCKIEIKEVGKYV